MKVASKLVKMDFVIGKIERKDQYLIIYSHPDSTIPAKVRMDAVDVWMLLRAMLNWQVIVYLLSLPVLYRRAKHQAREEK
ncbi:MAG: hypothetical protein GXP38_17770 [Chloroflexi bacterium]|nr:hypothetical protein [Chloroflexota bacterium]